jgi:uncharacterized protein
VSIEFEHTSAAPVSRLATEHSVRMRDGVRLAADVYLPDAGGGATEVVLVRLPYDKCGDYCFMPRIAPMFTAQGYVVVVQDVRGKFRSEGDPIPFVNEVCDGYDTLEWITAQPWCNGRVGMFGDSYYGFTQWAAVASGHRSLCAICPRCTGADVVEVARAGSGEVDLLLMGHYLAQHWVGHDAYHFEMDWRPRPLLAAFERVWKALGARSYGFDLWYPHTVPLRRYPTGHPFDARPVPTLQLMGWFDNIAPWQWSDHERLAERPNWAQLEYLYIDSVDHEIYHLDDTPITPEGDHAVNDAAFDQLLPRYIAPVLEFFGVFLRGGRAAADAPERVRWRVAHGGWRASDRWPPVGVSTTTYYLTDAAAATSGVPGGRLAVDAPDAAQQATWTHDPQRLVPSRVRDPFAFLRDYPDERDDGLRDDVLVFTARPVDTPLELAGPIDLHLALTTSGPSMDVFARLLDVDPTGAAHLISRGQTHTNAATAEVRVRLGHAGYLLRAAHSLRLHIASSDFPEYLPHPGTSDNRWLATTTATNRQALALGGRGPARLVITVQG